MTGAGEPARIQAVLLDIEGTTTPIAFVVETLFEYARRQIRSYVERHADAPDHARLFAQLRGEHAANVQSGQAAPEWTDAPPSARHASIVRYVEWLMGQDRKSTALKELQGKVWEEGYRRGELAGVVFPDVRNALARWRAQGLSIAIFSSGSVLAQQWLFRSCTDGDLTTFLSRFFDTTTGPKSDVESYRHIARALGVEPAAILFISDVTRELAAARGAGMKTRLAIRPGNAPQPDAAEYEVIEDFGTLEIR